MTTRIELYQKLPEAVSDFLFDREKEQEALVALKALGASDEQAFDFLLLAEDVVLGSLKLSELAGKVGKDDVARVLITHRLLPLEQYLGGVGDELKRLGGDPQTASVERVEKEELSAEQFVQDTLHEAKLSLSDSGLQDRLEFLLSTYVRGVRSAEQTIAALERSVKVGGLELDPAQSKQLIALLDARRPSYDVEVGAVGELLERSQTMDVQKETSVKKEMPQVARVTPQSPPRPLPTQEIEAPSSLSADLVKRLNSITQARLKDVRDALQTKTLLAQSVLTGGLGLLGSELDRVALEIEKKYAAELGKHDARVKESQAQYVQQMRERKETSRKQAAANEEELTKRYVALTGKAPQPIKPVTPRLSAASVPPQTGEKPQVVDVKYVQKLAGPIEELQTMTLVDFRRLSNDPKEAATKLRDKVDLLQNEAYEKKIAGIRAWKSSPLGQMYVILSQEALRTGKPILDVAKAWKEQGKETPTGEEIKAIIALNASMRF